MSVEFSIKSSSPEKQRSACIVVGVFESRKLSAAADVINKASAKFLSGIVQRGDMDGKAGTTLLLHKVPGVLAERVMLLGLGKEKDFGEKEFRSAIAAAVRALQKTGAGDAVLYLTALEFKKRDAAWRVRQATLVTQDVLYRFDGLKSKKKDSEPTLGKLAFGVAGSEAKSAERALTEGQAIAAGSYLTRDLGNLPSNICTPSYLAATAKILAKEYGMKLEVFERAAIEKMGMHSFVAVAKGAHEPAKFIVVQYRKGKASDKPIVLVGKGITFDTGGISLKPAPEMDEMKYDMCGAASVLGTLKAVAQMQLPINLIVAIPATENMPGGGATRPGDIVKTLSGQTVEILNTDAEGRLVLCDVLTYVERFEPQCVIDVATLTGACVIALGHVASGLFSNDDKLAGELLAAGQDTGDRAWHMPLWDDYQEQLQSNFADMANIGGRPAGSVTAACFLSRYTEKYTWAHLDIAGTAWRSGKSKGATGRPVPLLSEFLMRRAGKK